jgi:hypothetical protein
LPSADAPLTTSCDDALAHPFNLAADGRPVRFSVPPGAAPWFFGVELPASASASLRQLSYTESSIRICRDCSSADDGCETVGSGQLVHLRERSGPNVVHVVPSASTYINTTLSLTADTPSP